MENTLNYQFNYALPAVSSPPRVDRNATVFASEVGVVASLSSQECAFQVRRSGEMHVMTFQVLQAMDQCREFRTLDEHVARVQSSISALAGKRDDVKRVLDSLVERRLLISNKDFVARLGSANARPQPPLRAIFIRGCDRPEQLGRLLQSLTEYERKFRANRRYVLLDDSILAANVNEQRDLLREFARNTGCKTSYIGRAESAKLVEKFCKALPDAKATIQQLLSRSAHPQAQRFGGGRGYNMALLLSAGMRLFLLDDDLRLPLRQRTDAGRGLDPNPNSRVRVSFSASMDDAFAFGDEVADDPFELHLQNCGQPLGALTQSRYPLDPSSLYGLNLSRIELLAPESRIVATQSGTYGSTRTANSQWLYYRLDADSRAEFWADRASYQRNMEGHHIVYAVNSARVLSEWGFTPFSLDNSELLPCTNAVGRGEDSLAAALTHFCHPNALTLEVPEAIGHMQEVARKRSDRTLAAHAAHANYFLRDFVKRQFGLFSAADPTRRLHLLADVMRDLAFATTNDRIAHLREYLNYARADIIDSIQHEIEALQDAPLYWQADARAIVQANARALLAKTPPSLSEWPEDIDDAGCATALATELNGMADSLEHWPEIWRYAAEQSERLLTSL